MIVNPASSYFKLALTWDIAYCLRDLRLLFIVLFKYFQNDGSSALPYLPPLSTGLLSLPSYSLGIFRNAGLIATRCLSRPCLSPSIFSSLLYPGFLFSFTPSTSRGLVEADSCAAFWSFEQHCPPFILHFLHQKTPHLNGGGQCPL